MSVRTGISFVALLLLCGCHQETAIDAAGQAPTRELRELPAEAKTSLEAAATADELVLYSLNPHISFGERGKQVEGAFRGWPILGEARVRERAERERLWAALALGIRQKVGAAACFDPRHGIRASLPDGTSMDWVICFECHEVHVRHGDNFASFTTSGNPARVFNAVLRDAGVQIAH